MDLRQMEIAVAVAEEGGFTAAAQRLRTVQSTVSTTVRALERDLGTPLFERTTHRVALTPAGEAFLPAARAALRAADEARATVDLSRWRLRGEATIGTMPGLGSRLHRALAGLRRHHPGIDVRVRQAPAGELCQAIRESTVDLAIAVLDKRQRYGLVTRLLADEDMVLVTSPAASPPQPGPVTLGEAAGLSLVDFPPGWAIRESVDHAFRAALLDRAVTVEVDDLTAAAELVRHGLGGCVLPESIAAWFPDLVVRRFAEHAPNWRVQLARPGGDVSPVVAAVLRGLG
ncbi:LysR family transcriptional regulator [Amycolatopsis sp. NPDC059021]|uniref:LysR family transcriptional regulator n=1 Tax=Amycolatopsis sp. NPDC059021 TaxID=3346704 RepID=UPI0036732746